VTLDTNGRLPNYDDLINAETRLAEENVEIEDATTAWIMHPRDRGTFRRTTDANGNPLLYPAYNEKPYNEMIGYRTFTTTQIDNAQTTGTNSDTSDIYFGNWRFAEYVIGNDIEIILDDMTLADQLQVRFIAYLYSDLIIHYPEAFYVMSGVRAQA
jgi:HK97 family phage major capsid protein